MEVRSFRDLRVWQSSMELVEEVYVLTRAFPSHELFGLTSQLRRAAVSVPSNIAEGHSRRATRAYVNFLSIARGSLAEVSTQLEIAVRLKYVARSETAPIESRVLSLLRQVTSLADSLEERIAPQHSPA